MSLRIAPETHTEKVTSTLNTTHAEFGGHDAMRYGTRSIKSEWETTQWELKLNLARQAYGMHAPIKMMMERSLIEKRQRMPAIPSSNLHLDILTGRDETIDYEDFLNNPAESTDMLDIHASMEQKLRLKV
ncbi:proteasome maturation factor UMP1-domain-containing protein [Gilbertella persicaria]|uniref:proteasome maturation factor UMP1-domain-containing protein n=1 Tax=Gilbertella persicaria TaxID=101096 RepID=UPI00221FAC17|nr:proteasome maturation factor UMP1-domain-containing protein [Gilbertella persicaria]KAI8061500.1 proteasome maturation factor UMP1-domain-containing protein [Gilbertella persicaria]